MEEKSRTPEEHAAATLWAFAGMFLKGCRVTVQRREGWRSVFVLEIPHGSWMTVSVYVMAVIKGLEQLHGRFGLQPRGLLTVLVEALGFEGPREGNRGVEEGEEGAVSC